MGKQFNPFEETYLKYNDLDNPYLVIIDDMKDDFGYIFDVDRSTLS